MINKRHNYYIILMFVIATALISLSLPKHKQGQVPTQDIEVGQPWLHDALIAPFDIPITLPADQQQHITDSITKNFNKIYKRSDNKGDYQVALLTKAMWDIPEINSSARKKLISKLTQAYDNGIVDSETASEISNRNMKQIRILHDNGEEEYQSTEEIRSIRQVYTIIDSALTGVDPSAKKLLGLSNYIVANITFDESTTKKLLEEKIEMALTPTGTVVKGAAIVYRGNIITAQQKVIIETLNEMTSKKAKESNLDENLMLLGKILLITIIMLMYCTFLIAMRYRVYSNMRSMVFLVSFMALFIIVVFMIVTYKANYINLIPFAIVPIIITSFFDTRISFFTHIVVIIICSLASSEQAEFIIMQFLAGCIAIASMQQLTRRSQLVRCALLILIAYSATHSAIFLSKGGNIAELGNNSNWHIFVYFAINCMVLSFAYVGIFVVEKIFGFTSLVTLVELSDINTPVLRQLSERCPGTFQHVLQVANISAEAAIKVGASQQLARAGALYHDIGKIENPAFFTENQTGVNPHDSLAPDQSAHIVINHVIDGMRLADKARLPKELKDIIAQHHGTSITRYFYNQACKEAGDQTVDAAAYTYPGPRPRSKEAAIIMMADACEAAVRSLTDHDEKTIAALVEKIIDGQIASGQLKDAPISFMQVEMVKKVFIERLKIFYHRRISYPEDIKRNEPKATPVDEGNSTE